MRFVLLSFVVVRPVLRNVFALAVAIFFFGITPALASRGTILHHFSGNAEGSEPIYALTPDGSGNFFGVTFTGGEYSGDAFKLSPNGSGGWDYTEIYEFNDCSSGCYPTGPLTLDGNGNFYGTTQTGGTNYGGTVFELSPQPDGTWSHVVLYNFGADTKDATYPNGVVYFKGALYGTSFEGGEQRTGTVFMITQNPDGTWSESVLHSFGWNVQVAQNPLGGVALDQNGNIYGMTELGGAAQAGTVFKMSINRKGAWTFSVIHAFDGADGAMPWYAAPILDNQGNLYGTTVTGGSGGNGTVFKLTPSGNQWVITVLHNFTGGEDGSCPYGGVTMDSEGRLYGTTIEGGGRGTCTIPPSTQNVYCGTAFVLTPTKSGEWKESFLHRFSNGSDGSYPTAALVLDSEENIYGLAEGGGRYPAFGVAFEFAHLAK